MEPYIFVLPFAVCTTQTPPVQVEIMFNATGVDSNGLTFALSYSYIYDNTLAQSENFANIKAGIVAQAALIDGVKLATNNVNLIMTVN